ncbi:MAG: dihydrodipicolinate synthase family protein, partial [Myxococcales bacterium]|nr:dihydrodipicolinate synthase family protein [Myxococcales bacterium]
MRSFEGTLTALITPFRDDALDERALRELVERQIAAGISGLVPCGTTGESVTLRTEEHHAVVRIVAEQARGRVPVLAGAGSNCTRHAIELSKLSLEAGADGLLLVCPYYNKPTQAGLVAHFQAIL